MIFFFFHLKFKITSCFVLLCFVYSRKCWKLLRPLFLHSELHLTFDPDGFNPTRANQSSRLALDQSDPKSKKASDKPANNKVKIPMTQPASESTGAAKKSSKEAEPRESAEQEKFNNQSISLEFSHSPLNIF